MNQDIKSGNPCEHDEKHIRPTGVGQTETGRQFIAKTCYECLETWGVWESWELGDSDESSSD